MPDDLAGHSIFVDGLLNLGDRPALHVESLDLGLVHVDPGALDVSLVAVEDRQGYRDPDRPRCPALPAIGCIVLVRERLIKQVSVLEAVGPLELDIGFGDQDPEAVGRHVGTAVERDLDQLVVGGGRRRDVLNRAAQLESLGLVRGQDSTVPPGCRFFWRRFSSASSNPATAISRSDLA